MAELQRENIAQAMACVGGRTIRENFFVGFYGCSNTPAGSLKYRSKDSTLPPYPVWRCPHFWRESAGKRVLLAGWRITGNARP